MIDNIFTALVRERTPGVILEFILWCTVCLAALMSLIALAMGRGQVTWIILMLFSAGLGVLMAFRLKGISMLYSVCAFYFVTFLVHYLSLSIGYADGESLSPLNIILFILILMLSLAIMACGFVHFFSRFNLGTPMTILVLCASCAMALLHILMYTSDYIGSSRYINVYHRSWMNYRGYWVGTVSYWLLLAVVAVYFACLFWGPIDRRKEKIYVPGQGGGRMPEIRGLYGLYAGRVIPIQGTVTIGSGEGCSILISDPYVSRVHCAVRFNPATGFYEVLDQSSNGVWLQNGGWLQKNVYNSVRRGSVICIGSKNQQFRLQ